jgi:hypothetical protein
MTVRAVDEAGMLVDELFPMDGYLTDPIDISRFTVDYLPYAVMPPVEYVPSLSFGGSP